MQVAVSSRPAASLLCPGSGMTPGQPTFTNESFTSSPTRPILTFCWARTILCRRNCSSLTSLLSYRSWNTRRGPKQTTPPSLPQRRDRSRKKLRWRSRKRRSRKRRMERE
ncbi:hypothetical protein B0T26DRAFT_869767 [Lasiosphaeria miniovina]|uniref:Uncharacterized protein n=1 Tax=Lasiosphaeria miniovina TaxID=1954250 RepID=A0AA40B726_9PEZI|nr:uncharacterized protein B0T26DRAFT_869767 [Lasiosphaeria miniovina]KAK0728799.1 hypothetical protein B0T26DRAFT_869767 [Lasiosphaeria miniovina]